MQSTQAGLLFDISNAYISKQNGICPLEKWHSQLKSCQHFHVAGFRVAENGIALDTHDAPIAAGVYDWINNILFSSAEKTLVVELDHQINFSFWKSEIIKVKNSIAAETKIRVSKQCAQIKNAKEAVEKIAQQHLQQAILDAVPSLKERGNDLFGAFFTWMRQKNISAGWGLPMHLL